MRLQLVVTRGPDMGTVFELEMMGTYVLGRGEDCSIQLSDARVSRHHCRLVVSGGKAQIEDTNSSWGTLVNGEAISSRQLQPGDVVKLVETEMRFEVSTSAAATTWQPDQPPPQPATLPEPSPGPAPQPAADSPAPRPAPPPPPSKESPPRPKPRSAPKPPPKAKPTGAPQPGGSDLSHLVGQKLSRYEITEVIARARTGMLFRAYDTTHDRQVAFKVVWPEIARDDDEVQRFVRAVKTVLGVRHPNLVSLYGAGKSAPRYCWTASELVEGDGLMDVMIQVGQNERLPWAQCLRIAIHIARAIEAAAAKGFVHRNVTPTNILIRKKDGVAKLGDLMLAKAMEGSQAANITRPGETVGDIPYLSPEQLTTQHKLDSRADIYGLGASIYHAVTGRPPIEGTSLAQTIARVESEMPPDPRELAPDIPPQFAAVIMQMLAKQPKDRCRTPTDLVRTLEKAAANTGQPVVPLPEGDEAFVGGEFTWTGVGRWLREIPWPVRRNSMIAVVLLIVAVMLGLLLDSMLSR